MLEKCGEVIHLCPGSTRRDMWKAFKRADAIVTRGFTRIPKELLEVAENLKVIGIHGVGSDHIDVDFAEKRGIEIVRTPTALTNTVAEFTVALMLCLLKKILIADTALRGGEWNRKYLDLVGNDLMDRVVGILGLGRIGSAVAERLAPFNVKLMYYERSRARELEKRHGVQYVPFDRLLETSDILSIHIPSTTETYHMISEREFELMKPGVYIVNTSRGSVVDERALFNAVMSGKVAGAALDVFESEPLDPRSPLIQLKNVILTPHLAASSEESLSRMAMEVAKEIISRLHAL